MTDATRKILVSDENFGYFITDDVLKLYCVLMGFDFLEPSGLIKNNDGTLLTLYDIPRDDINLIKAVETIGIKNTVLKIVKIPYDVDWCIENSDGMEWVAEKHRTWGK